MSTETKSHLLAVAPEVHNIENRIFTIRGQQVLLDRDLAVLYGVGTKVLNQAVKRNQERFPERYMFQITKEEYNECKTILQGSSSCLKSQIVTSNTHGGDRKLPKVFTEQGVAMLSSVLKSETAIRMSILIMDAFVAMRQFIAHNAQLFQRMSNLEQKQLQTDQKVNAILEKIENGRIVAPKQGIFFDGQIFDAYQFVIDLIASAKHSIVLIDNYVDNTTLLMFAKRCADVSATIYTKNIGAILQQDVAKFNAQYPPVEVKIMTNSHDRFIILDDSEMYLIGASLKDLGKKWFAFSKIDDPQVLQSVKVRLDERG